MWAYTLTAPRHFERVDVPEPVESALKDRQVIIRMLAGAVCGSDLAPFKGHHVEHAQFAGDYAPNYTGYPMHEVVGEVVASRSPELSTGTRVVGWAGHHDALAEYVVTSDDVVTVDDSGLDPTISILIQTLACVSYAVDRLGDVEGHHTAVLGQGPIGTLFSHLLKVRGAAKVTAVDVVDRADVAAAFDVDEFVHGSSDRWARRIADPDRPSVVVDAIGHQAFTLNDAVTAIAKDGRLYYFGLPEVPQVAFDLHTFFRKQLTMFAGVTQSRRRYLDVARDHLRSHPFLAERYVTHVYDIDDVDQAFEAACSPTRGRIKISIRMA